MSTDDRTDTEARLSRLRPVALPNRDALLFAAGRQSVRPNWAWPFIALTCALLALVLPTARMVIVVVPVAQPPSPPVVEPLPNTAPTPLTAPSPPEEVPLPFVSLPPAVDPLTTLDPVTGEVSGRRTSASFPSLSLFPSLGESE